jgi:hypothetical protein
VKDSSGVFNTRAVGDGILSISCSWEMCADIGEDSLGEIRISPTVEGISLS